MASDGGTGATGGVGGASATRGVLGVSAAPGSGDFFHSLRRPGLVFSGCSARPGCCGSAWAKTGGAGGGGETAGGGGDTASSGGGGGVGICRVGSSGASAAGRCGSGRPARPAPRAKAPTLTASPAARTVGQHARAW